MQARRIKQVTAINAVTATTTSSAIPVQGAERIMFEFTRADHGSGSSTFTVEGSIDGGTTFTALNTIVTNVTNTNAQNYTRVASVALSSDTTQVASLDLNHDAFTHIKIKVTETTDGTHTAKVLVKY